MKKITSLPITIFSALVLVAMVSLNGCMPHSTGSTEVGVRTKKFAIFSKRGVEEKAYPPGATYFFFPIINDWHTFDTKIQNLEMTYDAKTGDVKMRDDLLFKTIDGNDISLDVIITYHIKPEDAPKILQNVARNDKELRFNIVRAICRSKPRDIFGELKTEEFYISDKRSEKAQAATAQLNEILNPWGVVVEQVLTRDYRFNPAYQKAIEDKKIADQLAEQNKSASRAATEEYRKKLEDARGEVNKMVAEADGRFLQAKIEADAYFEKQQKIAAAIEAEGKAEAEGISKMNEALSGEGGEAMVKLKLAEALAGKRIMLLPLAGGDGIDLKTTDINRLLETYGVKSLSNSTQEQK